MDDGSRYSGYDGCIVGGTRPTNVDVVAGTRSTVDRAGTRAIRSIVDMPGTRATTVDCGGTYSHDWDYVAGTLCHGGLRWWYSFNGRIYMNEGLRPVIKRSGRPRMVRSIRRGYDGTEKGLTESYVG